MTTPPAADAASRSFVSRHPLLAYLGEYRNHRGRVAGAVSLALIKHSPVVFIPMYTKYIFDVAIPARDVVSLAACLVGMTALIIMNLMLHPVSMRMFSEARREVALRLRSALCTRIQSLVFAYYNAANSGRLHSKVMQDVEKLDNFGKAMFDPIIPVFASSIASFFILLYVNPLFLIPVLAFLPIVLIQRLWFSRNVEDRFNRLRIEQEKLNAEVGEMIGMLGLSRAHATEEQDLRRLGARLGNVRDVGVQTDWSHHVLNSQMWCTMQLLNIAVVILGAYLAISGKMSLGDIVLAMSLVMMTVGGVGAIIGQLEVLFSAAEAMRSIDEVMNHPAVEQNEGKPALPALEGHVEFDDVWFAYPGNECPVLKSISLDVAPNQTIALVGPSGAGKTTFINLLLGFYDPVQGRVRVDGHEMGAFDRRSLRRQVGIVTQETFLFNGTIWHNMTHGLEGITQDQVEAAARQAHAHDFIVALGEGYQTVIGDRGLRLSGGQKQRLAIARALLRNPRLLILDEATSALDSQSERAVQQALEHLMAGRTTFVIAHRLSTVRNADRILVFDEGRIVEDGRHELLLNNHGLYAKLVELQEIG